MENEKVAEIKKEIYRLINKNENIEKLKIIHTFIRELIGKSS